MAGKYSDRWHELHLLDPRSVVPESIMPAYPWLAQRPASGVGDIQAKLRVLQQLGHPYADEEIEAAPQQLEGLRELDALIVYLQLLGSFHDPAAADTGHGGH
jgi:cytochrome c oxidase cbb3-type subunit 2